MLCLTLAVANRNLIEPETSEALMDAPSGAHHQSVKEFVRSRPVDHPNIHTAEMAANITSVMLCKEI